MVKPCQGLRLGLIALLEEQFPGYHPVVAMASIANDASLKPEGHPTIVGSDCLRHAWIVSDDTEQTKTRNQQVEASLPLSRPSFGIRFTGNFHDFWRHFWGNLAKIYRRTLSLRRRAGPYPALYPSLVGVPPSIGLVALPAGGTLVTRG